MLVLTGLLGVRIFRLSAAAQDENEAKFAEFICLANEWQAIFNRKNNR